MTARPELSVVIPLFNEQEGVPALLERLSGALGSLSSWELILVDDGSTDGTAERVATVAGADSRVRLIRLARNYGQTPAMQAGFDHASGDVVVSMDGDLQNDPEDITRLVAKLAEGYDLVAGYRERRKDQWLTRRVPSWLANRLIRWITAVPIRDNGCSLKAYRRELLERLHLYSDMHRFIPAVAAATAGARITEIPVRHHARKFGASKYGLSRVFKVLADLLTILMIRSFRERPLALFGAAAVGAWGVAALFASMVVLFQPGFSGGKADTVVLTGVAALWFGLGLYLMMLGLIGEVAVREESWDLSDRLPMVREITS